MFWGLSERGSWQSGQRRLIFGATNQPNSAYGAIIDLVMPPIPDLALPR